MQLYIRAPASDEYVFTARTETADRLSQCVFTQQLSLFHYSNRDQEIALILSYGEAPANPKYFVGFAFTTARKLVHWAYTSFNMKISNPYDELWNAKLELLKSSLRISCLSLASPRYMLDFRFPTVAPTYLQYLAHNSQIT